ncbi:Flp pilus assembly protein CpaB [[Empedobacter] haloabium]|uniref:Flp pilus assembly protein CpaB n=1 Tax=[Empedobacter] haloabium TaxID=592317 RepID=A0ABZ1UJX8_9BURK
MKNRRAYLMMALAIVLGLGAVAMASRLLLRQAPASGSRIVVATGDASLGQRIGPEMVKLSDWPADSVPTGALRDPLALSGRVLKSSVLRGEPLTEAKLAPAGTLGGLSALITEGKRAITVRVNDVIGVAGFALPGNFVDILVSTQAGGAQHNDEAISKIVLERILVLAVAQEVSRDDTKPRVVNAVTLEVAPDQAEKLDLARSVGSLSLVLRNQVDPQPGTTAGATKSSLLGLAKTQPVASAGAPVAQRAVPKVAHSEPPRHCIGTIDGLHSGRQCL